MVVILLHAVLLVLLARVLEQLFQLDDLAVFVRLLLLAFFITH